jgi:hypothetical protein
MISVVQGNYWIRRIVGSYRQTQGFDVVNFSEVAIMKRGAEV